MDRKVNKNKGEFTPEPNFVNHQINQPELIIHTQPLITFLLVAMLLRSKST